jgi:CBS domain-containing protein
MRVKDLMSSPVVCVSPDTPLRQVATILVDRGISALPVVNAEGRLVGIVSEADLVRVATGEGPTHPAHADPLVPVVPTRVGDVMTRDVVTLPEEADAVDAARLMLERRVKRLPVMAGDHVVGVVSRRDLLRTMVRDDADIAAEVESLLGKEAFMVGRFGVEVRRGVVTLSGGGEPSERRLAELIARGVSGVLGVRFDESDAGVGARG